MSPSLPTEQTLNEFHTMIDSVRAIEVPLDCDANTIAELREIVRQRIVNQPGDFDSKEAVASQSDWTQRLPQSYTDALSVFGSSGDAELALNRLTIESNIENELTGAVRPSWIYLASMLLLASGGIAVFALVSVPAIEAMKVDMDLVPKHRLRPSAPWFAHAWSIVVGLVVASLGLLLAATLTRFAAWSANGFGGKQYRRLRMQNIESEIRHSLATVANAKPQPNFRNLFARDYLRIQAVAQLKRLRVMVPVVLIVLLGGVGVMAYCWMLFSPLIALIYDLSVIETSGGITR